MQTHLELSRTASDGLAEDLTDRLLQARAAIPPAANGLPPKSSSPRVVYLRNQIGSRKMQPIHSLLTLIADDLACGVPVSEHLAWIDRLRASVEAMAVTTWMQKREQPVKPQLVRESLKETALEGKANPAQERMIVDLDNLASLDAFILHGERHHAQLGTVLRLAHQLRVEKGDLAKRVYGARRHA